MQHFKSDAEDKKVKLLKTSNHFCIQRKFCVNEEGYGSVLTKFGCRTSVDGEQGNKVDRNLVLKPLEPRVRRCASDLIYYLISIILVLIYIII